MLSRMGSHLSAYLRGQKDHRNCQNYQLRGPAFIYQYVQVLIQSCAVTLIMKNLNKIGPALQVLKEFGSPGVTLTVSFSYIKQIEPSLPPSLRERLLFEFKLPYAERHKIPLLSEKLDEAGVEMKGEGYQSLFKANIGVGDKFRNYTELPRVMVHGEEILHHKDGQVLLVDMWASWCGFCYQPMRENASILKEGGYGDKLRIVGVSLDQSIQEARQAIQKEGWHQIRHLLQGEFKGIKEDYGFKGIPFVILVDKAGVVNYVGHPKQTNLKARIDHLVNDKVYHQPTKEEKAPNNQEPTPAEDVVKLIEEEFSKSELGCQAYLQLIMKFKGHQRTEVTKTARLSAFQKERHLVELLDGTNWNVQKKVYKTIELPKPSAGCHECKQDLKYPLYYCKWSTDSDDFRCVPCVDTKGADGMPRYQENAILIMAPKNMIPAEYLGNNVKPKARTAEQRQHQGSCDSCQGPIEGTRFACLQCKVLEQRIYDHCGVCLERTIKEQKAFWQYPKHKIQHALVRIPFYVDYYNY